MLQVNNISFGYEKKNVLEHISFNAQPGEHMSIIGESGSGKSTLLKLLYGEYDLNEGKILWNDTEILGPKYNLVIGYDFMKYVAQEFDLMPYTSVEENVGKHLSNFFPKEKEMRINELLQVVELSDFSKTKVKKLSGGQKQRVALARALAKQPQILLLDEPFSHIDNFKKQSLRRNLFSYLKEKHITCIVATHDKEDVLGYADNMVVLHKSKIMAQDTPENLYKNPKNPLIASFFGEFTQFESHGIVYASQLKKVAHSKMEAIVKKSYFKGNYYLVQAESNQKQLFFENDSDIDIGTKVFLEILL